MASPRKLVIIQASTVDLWHRNHILIPHLPLSWLQLYLSKPLGIEHSTDHWKCAGNPSQTLLAVLKEMSRRLTMATIWTVFFLQPGQFVSLTATLQMKWPLCCSTKKIRMNEVPSGLQIKQMGWGNSLNAQLTKRWMKEAGGTSGHCWMTTSELRDGSGWVLGRGLGKGEWGSFWKFFLKAAPWKPLKDDWC